MRVELTVIHNEQQYILNGEATLSKFKSLENNDEFTKVTFVDKTEDELIEWQSQFNWDDKCRLGTSTEVYEGLYKASSRMDGSLIILLDKEIL